MSAPYDVCVIGSGAGGAPVAAALAEAGYRVVLLEKGPRYARRDFLRDEIVHHNRAVTAILRDGLLALGASVLAPGAPRGSLVAFETPRFAEITSALADADVTVWARDGRVRMSAHAYTTEDDAATALRVLDTIGAT